MGKKKLSDSDEAVEAAFMAQRRASLVDAATRRGEAVHNLRVAYRKFNEGGQGMHAAKCAAALSALGENVE